MIKVIKNMLYNLINPTELPLFLINKLLVYLLILIQTILIFEFINFNTLLNKLKNQLIIFIFFLIV